MKWAHAHWLMCGSGWTNEMISQWGRKGVIGPKPQQRGDARGTRPPPVLVHLARFPYSKCYWLIGTLQRAYLRAGTHSQVAQWSRICLPSQETQETWVRFLGQEDPLEKEVATRTSILAWGSHGQRSLVGYSPWGHKESDTTERLSTHQSGILSQGKTEALSFMLGLQTTFNQMPAKPVCSWEHQDEKCRGVTRQPKESALFVFFACRWPL